MPYVTVGQGATINSLGPRRGKARANFVPYRGGMSGLVTVGQGGTIATLGPRRGKGNPRFVPYRGGMGDFTNPFTWGDPSQYGSTAWYAAQLNNFLTQTPWWSGNPTVDTADAPAGSWFGPPAPAGSGDFIPGSSTTDYLLNAITGKPTNAQLNYNSAGYQDAVAQMADTLTAQGVPLPAVLDPSVAAAQATQDQVNYASASGGTAQQTFGLAGPGASDDPVTLWAWVILGGVVAFMFATR
jgi:hypothetical protein